MFVFVFFFYQRLNFFDRLEFVSGENQQSEIWTTLKILQTRIESIVTEIQLKKKEENRFFVFFNGFTLRSLGNWGNLAKDCNPTLMMERTRRLENSSVKPWIEEQRAQLSKTNSFIYSNNNGDRDNLPFLFLFLSFIHWLNWVLDVELREKCVGPSDSVRWRVHFHLEFSLLTWWQREFLFND